MQLELLVKSKKWIKFFLNEKKEAIPFDEESNKVYLTQNPKWSLVYKMVGG